MDTMILLDAPDRLDTRPRGAHGRARIDCGARPDGGTPVLPPSEAAITYRLVRTAGGAFPLYVDARDPGPHPPALSPLIDGRGDGR